MDYFSRRQRGLQAELSAEVFLLNQSLVFIERNYRCKTGEIDLIFSEPPVTHRLPTLVFVEVRSRLVGSSWEDPFSSVGYPKRQRLRRAIEFYLWRRGRVFTQRFDQIRIDVLGFDGGWWEWRKGIEL